MRTVLFLSILIVSLPVFGCNRNVEATRLKVAIENGDIQAVRTIVNDDDQGNIRIKTGSDPECWATPLHIAAKENDAQIVTLLLSLGGDPNTPDYDGCTPIFYAVESTHDDSSQVVLTTLIESGAGIDVRCRSYGLTPLMYAVVCNNFYAAKALVRSGADLTLTDVKGRTAFQVAEDAGTIDATWKELLLGGQ